MLVGCAAAPPPPPAPPSAAFPEPARPDVAVASNDAPSPPPIAVTDAEERSRSPSTASYDQALSTPEPVDIEDGHPHLTDVQLWSPMGGALQGCHVPRSAKVTIKTAVQNGRAIGVTVDVRLEKPKPTKRPKPAAVKAEQKAIAKISTCVDRNVRVTTWPPNRRRDSFTTEL